MGCCISAEEAQQAKAPTTVMLLDSDGTGRTAPMSTSLPMKQPGRSARKPRPPRIHALVVPIKEAPYLINIANDGRLSDLDAIVQGKSVDVVDAGPRYALYINDEGKLQGLEPNETLARAHPEWLLLIGGIAGNAVLVAEDETFEDGNTDVPPGVNLTRVLEEGAVRLREKGRKRKALESTEISFSMYPSYAEDVLKKLGFMDAAHNPRSSSAAA